ncbi:hypothetical protein VTN96DRAFT_3708 [Rasamsonia emersonii]
MTSNTSSGLNVIALISGGKDSLYSILHCIRNGHQVVALANLHPPIRSDESQQEDMDSFMYQTVGYKVIPLYETALGIPLYRAPITGGAVDTSGVYRNDAEDQTAESVPGHDDDETESLIPLLRRIKREHPSANAVSAGAILSTYQRTRIENVAGRLGLVPLAWLWMYPHLPPPEERKGSSDSIPPSDTGLLDDMASCGCESRIIKVASGGLDDDFLWGNVASQDGQTRKQIAKAMRRFAAEDLRGAVLGEGGEYETLALDGPDFLWKQRIVVEERDRQVRKGDGGVSYVTITEAKCVPKAANAASIQPESVRLPSRLDDSFERALNEIRTRSEAYQEDSIADLQPTTITRRSQADIGITQSSDGSLWAISNLTAPEAGPGAGEQMNGISKKLEQILESYTDPRHRRRAPEDIVFATVLLRSMEDFASVNGVYVSLFKKPNPPARVTVACGDSLPDGVEVMASFVVDLGPRDMRQGLHVQSRSYWAPANIGPYSQAITVPSSPGQAIESGGGLVFIAGQIPLDPASMEVADGLSTDEDTWFENFSLHATLSLQHLWRIGVAMRVDWWLGAVVFLANDQQQRVQGKVRVAWELWKNMNSQHINQNDDDDEEVALDAWDIKYGRREDPRHASPRGHSLPNLDVVSGTPQMPPFLAVQVDTLPRGSDIEWQGLGSRCDRVKITAEDTTSQSDKVWSTVVDDQTTFYSIEIGTEQFGPSFETHVQQVLGRLGDDVIETAQLTIYTACPLTKGPWKGQVVPCKAVWGQQGRRLAAGITVRATTAG